MARAESKLRAESGPRQASARSCGTVDGLVRVIGQTKIDVRPTSQRFGLRGRGWPVRPPRQFRVAFCEACKRNRARGLTVAGEAGEVGAFTTAVVLGRADEELLREGE